MWVEREWEEKEMERDTVGPAAAHGVAQETEEAQGRSSAAAALDLVYVWWAFDEENLAELAKLLYCPAKSIFPAKPRSLWYSTRTTMSTGIVSITTSQQLDAALHAATAPLSVCYFWASWCKPCEQMDLVVEQLAQKYSTVLFYKVCATFIPFFFAVSDRIME